MPRYRITEMAFIDNRLVQPGEEVEVGDNHKPGKCWVRVDKIDKRTKEYRDRQEGSDEAV